MAQYATLKATIDAYIRQNGVKAITGPVLNGVLNAMVESLGNGYLFEGEALPNGDPGTPDQNVVRYATRAGTYTNYGGYVHDGKHLVWLIWNGSWHAHASQVPTDAALVNAITTAIADFYTKAQTDALLAGKQATLQSGVNIKTINNQSILGSGNITIQGGGGGEENVIEVVKVNGTALTPDENKAVDITVPTQLSQLTDNIGVSSKAEKVAGATAGDFAGLDADGNLVDSGSKASNFATAAQGGKADTAVQPGDLATVATSGDYEDLTNKPSIPAAQVQSDWDEADNTEPSFIKNKPAIPSVAGLESTSNKVTSLSSASDDTQYPSAKCVYDIVGNIETLLAAI